MLTAVMTALSGSVLHGLFLAVIMVAFVVIYIILTRNVKGYPTNLVITGAFLGAIATDVIWSLFNFGTSPIIVVYDGRAQLFYELMCCGVIFFSALTIANIIRRKKYRAAKVAVFTVFVISILVLALNLVAFGTLNFSIEFPGLSMFQTNIVFICIACASVIALGILAIYSSERSISKTVTALVLAAITVGVGTIGIYYSVNYDNYLIHHEKTQTAAVVSDDFMI